MYIIGISHEYQKSKMISIVEMSYYCLLKNIYPKYSKYSADMNSKLLDNFSYDLIESLVKYFFDFFPTLFRKLTSNDLNPRIFSIEKTKKCFFFHFFDTRNFLVCVDCGQFSKKSWKKFKNLLY